MRFRSNVEGPPDDILSRFVVRDPPKMIGGHDAPSDPIYEPECCYWTHDEAAILYQTVRRWRKGIWIDIGSRFGWTAAHILAGGADMVVAVDPIYRSERMYDRMLSNLEAPEAVIGTTTLDDGMRYARLIGAVIDGNHDWPIPHEDAAACILHGIDMLIFHDVIGAPVQAAVDLAATMGFGVKLYWTPNIVAVCWRNNPEFVPVDHVGDPGLMNDWKPAIAKTCLGRFVE